MVLMWSKQAAAITLVLLRAVSVRADDCHPEIVAAIRLECLT